jgi:hypothetical protein
MSEARYLLTRQYRCATCAGSGQLPALTAGAPAARCSLCDGDGWTLAVPVPFAEALGADASFLALVARVTALEKKPK